MSTSATFPATGHRIRPDDLVEIGGVTHTVQHTEQRAAGRVRLHFTDGNFYTLEAFRRLRVTRPVSLLPLRPRAAVHEAAGPVDGG